MRLLFISLISFGILGGCIYFYDDLSERGSTIIQYSLYVMFMIFTMRMNAKGNSSLAVKHMMALPMTHKQIVLSQSIADITFYFPISFVILYGFNLVKPEYHILLVGLIFHIALIAANIISFNKKIDLGRMQHTKASFKNSFVYVKKYLDTIIQIAIMVMIITILAVAFSSSIILQEYAFLILVIIFSFVVFGRTVKMLQDETQSYFLFDRDIKTVGFKLLLIGATMFGMHTVTNKIDKKKMLRQIAAHAEGLDYVENLSDKAKEFSVKVDEQQLFLDITKNNAKGLRLYLETHDGLPLDTEVMGNYLPHVAARYENIDVLEAIYKQDPEALNKPGKYRKTSPLQVTMRECNLEAAEFLIQHGVNLNHQNMDGNTALHSAALNNCYGGVLLLSEKGAKLDLKNKDGKELIDFIQGSGIDYIIENKHKRVIASEKSEQAPEESQE